jgi:hypothetical protein
MLPVEARHCEPEALVTSLDADAPRAQKTAPQLQDMIAAARENLIDEEIRELEELMRVRRRFWDEGERLRT